MSTPRFPYHRIIIEEIQKVHVRPYIVADGDDAVDDDAGPGAFPCNLAEERSQRDRTVCDQRVVLDVSGLTNLAVASSDFFLLIIRS